MQKLLLLLCLSLLSLNAKASCCSFKLAYTPEVLNVPSEERIMTCIETEHCDSLFLFVGRMIRAYEKREIDKVTDNFERILPIISEKDKGDTISLKIVYLYATFMEREGESTISSAYYKYVEASALARSPLNLLAKIGIAGIKNSISDLERLQANVVDIITSSSFTIEENLSILLRLNNYLDVKEGYRFFYDNSISAIHPPEGYKSELYYVYLNRIVQMLSDHEKDKRFNDMFSKAVNVFKYINKEKHYKSHLRMRSLVSIANDKYNDALKYSEELVGLYLDGSESINNIPENPLEYDVEKYKSIHLYATANLFQTRVRPGIEPVKKAFGLYEMLYRRKLKNSLSSVNSLIADKLLYASSYEINVLIVGYYLYKKTDDITYLNRAISVVDNNAGAGDYYWTSARSFARSNNSFWADVLEQQMATNTLSKVEEGTKISAVFAAQEVFMKQRSKIQTNYPGFFNNLIDNISINLEDVSTWCAQDSSSVLAFYMQNEELYRLLVTPDTVVLADMYTLRSSIINLADTLQSTSSPKTKPNQNAEASRELYSLLFSDIDSLLPPNLHVIATGALENVPFNALRREAPGEAARYLGVEVAISRQMSINSMRLMREQEMSPRYRRPLAMAPSFANESLAVSDLRQAGFVLPPLLYSTDEVKDLEARGPGNYFYGEEATLPNYLANVSDHSIIHLATHAISSQTDGLKSRIYLSSEDGETAELYASEIGDQTLNADLVVLSACETSSGGQHATEGRISLTKAYLAAGARSVVSSNWAVDDFATATMMKFFYQHIQDGKPPHQALQLSRKAYLEDFPGAPPYKWAAFDAYGGMKSVAWDRSRSVWPTIGYGALAIVSLGLATAYIRRRRKVAMRG